MLRSPIFPIAAGLLLLPPIATALAQQGGGGGGQQPVLDALQAHDAKLDAHAATLGAQLDALGALQPIPIDGCITISQPGSYRLTQNLVPLSLTASGVCLVVAADFVTIDLGGWTITGPPIGTGIGNSGDPLDPQPQRQGITVRNGTISGFDTGVRLSGLCSVVEEVRVTGSSDDGILVGDGIVSGNIVRDNGGDGISVGTGTVSGNTALDNRGTGIEVSCPSNVIGNTATSRVGGANLVLVDPGSCNDLDNLAP